MSTIRTFLIGMLAGVGLAALLATWARRGDAAELTQAKATFEAAKVEVRVDSVEVVKWATKTRALRDTFNIHDTLQVIEYVNRTDTLRQRCMACIASASRLGVAADTVFVKLEANSRKWTDRFGITAGYGAVLDRDGRIRTGPTLTASVKLWPWR